MLDCLSTCHIVKVFFGLLMPGHSAGFDIAIADIAFIFQWRFKDVILSINRNACRVSFLISEQTGYLRAVFEIILGMAHHRKEQFIRH